MPIKKTDFEQAKDITGKPREKKKKSRREAPASYTFAAHKKKQEREKKEKHYCFQDECQELTETKCLYCGRFYCNGHVVQKNHKCVE